MKLRVLSAVFASIACSVGVLAQDTSPQTTPKTITVTGCLQRAQASPTGTTGSTSSAASSTEPKFILTNASMGSGSSSTSTTAGTTGTASRSGMSANEYRLDATDAKLSPHVGHKVEVTGTLDSSPSSSSTSSTSSTSATSSSTSSTAPKLKVDDVKMVAATCP
jgi:hypothetical protein